MTIIDRGTFSLQKKLCTKILKLGNAQQHDQFGAHRYGAPSRHSSIMRYTAYDEGSKWPKPN